MQTFNRIPLKELDNITQSIELFNLKFNEKMKNIFLIICFFQVKNQKKEQKKWYLKKCSLQKK